MTKIIECTKCKKKKYYAKRLCRSCYMKQYMKQYQHPLIICKRCKEQKEHHAKGLCKSCYRKIHKPPLIICSVCNEEKEHQAKRLCKACYSREYPGSPKVIICKKCKREDKHKAKGLCKYCYDKIQNKKRYWDEKEKELKKAKEWRKNNPLRVRELDKTWKKKHPEQTRRIRRKSNSKRRLKLRGNIYAVGIPLNLQKRIFERDKVCVYQTNRCTYDKYLAIDHIQSVNKGGNNDPNNLVLACKKCNTSKFNKDVFEWCKEQKIPIPGIVLKLLTKQKEQTGL